MAIIVAPRARAAEAPIALGAYFFDNGRCAPGDESAIQAWCAKTGRLPAVWAIYQTWTGWNQFPANQARRAQSLGTTLMITWEPWRGQADDAQWSCAEIAAGTYDPYIRQYARAVRGCGVPVLMRLAHEMNGDWYSWGTAYGQNQARHNGNAPADYVAMWRHVVRIFRVEGARNAAWVWSPNVVYVNGVNSVERQNADLRALFPGDEWIDWMGLSVYNDGARRPWRSFSQLFDGSYRTLSALSQKPMMIAEFGVTEEGAPRGQSKAQWLLQTLLNEIPARYPRVRLVNYFFRDKTDMGEANYRFDSSLDALRAFQTVVASPLYGGNGSSFGRAPSPIYAGTSAPQVSVVSSAQLQPADEAPDVAMTGNRGWLRNGNIAVALPRINVGQ